MPVLTSSSASSPSRRLVGGGTYSSYLTGGTSGSSVYARSYSTSTATSSSRTSSLDRSPYASSTSSSYSSGYSSSSSYRPSITANRTTSSYSSTRTSPSRRSYLTSTSSTGSRSSGKDDVIRTGSSYSSQSESRDNYLNGNVKRGISSSSNSTNRDYSGSVYSSPSSKYRTSTSSASSTATSTSNNGRSRYSAERDLSGSEQLPRISERIRNFQPSRSVDAAPFRSRFLRPSGELQKNDDNNINNEESSGYSSSSKRPSVSDLRKRYDQNRNHVLESRTSPLTSKPPIVSRSGESPVAPARRATIESNSDSEESGSRTPVNNSSKTTLRRPEVKNSSSGRKDFLRSSSPSTLSSTSSSSDDGETQDSGVKLSGARGSLSSRNNTDAAGSTEEASLPSLSNNSPRLSSLLSSRNNRESPSSTRNNTSSTQQKSASENPAGLVGLRNIGNTCFMNSVLQCLSNTRPVLEYVISDEYAHHINTSSSSMNGALIKAFSIVLAELWKRDEDEDDGYSMAVNPTALKSQIQKFAPRFMGYNQQDAQEFLRYLLEGLHEDVNRIAVKPKPIETDISDNLSDGEKAAEAWKRYIRREDSRIVDLFVGQLKSTLQCVTCGHCSVTFDPFWDLSLPICSGRSSGSNVRLQHCLDLFAKEEILDGDEKPTCSKCQARRKCTKKFSIHKFPQILVLHLKRFSPGERFRKLDASVDFPLSELDLSAYASCRSSGYSYRLYGVINHSGSAYSGHYTASCRHPYTGTWHEYNDSKVSSLTAQRVVSSEAYLLFYELENV